METKFTKGPWQYQVANKPDNTGGIDCAILDPRGKIIAETFQNVDYDYCSLDNVYEKYPAEANAKLIAAAPDMYEALVAANQCIKDMVDCYSRRVSMIVLDEAVKSLKNDAGKLVKSALAKATA